MGIFSGNRQKLTDEERVEFQKMLEPGQTMSTTIIKLKKMNKTLTLTELRKEVRLAGYEYRNPNDCPTCNNQVLVRR